MAVSFVGTVGEFSDNVTGTSKTVSISKAVGVGDFLLLAARAGSGFRVSSVTDSSSNTWTLLNRTAASLNTTSVYYCNVSNALTTSSTVTVNFEGTTASTIGIWSFDGISKPTITSALANAANVTTLNSGTLTVPQYGSLIFSAFSLNNLSTLPTAAPTGYTLLSISGSNQRTIAAYAIAPSMASFGSTWSWVTTSNASIVSATITPDGGDFLQLL